MLIVSQNMCNITEDLKLNIKEIITCRNEIIDEKIWQKFKRVKRKKSENLSINDLKELGKFIQQDLTKSVYAIKNSENQISATYSRKEKAKEVLSDIIEKYDKEDLYKMPKEETELIIL